MESSTILREWFDRVDSAKTGNITPPQLQSALAVGNLDLPLSVVQQMIRMYDFNRNGTMNFEEFVFLNKFLLKVQQVFSDEERNRGFLITDEVYKALVKLGFSLDSPAFYTACESFDRKKNGEFRLDAFISLCIFLQSARNLFNSFDTTKQGRITLDLNQFIYCNYFGLFNRLQMEAEEVVKRPTKNSSESGDFSCEFEPGIVPRDFVFSNHPFQ